jgi:hypothetical protein
MQRNEIENKIEEAFIWTQDKSIQGNDYLQKVKKLIDLVNQDQD